MRGVTRFGVIALCLLALSAPPAAAVCAAMAESTDDCHMPAAHEVARCSEEIGPSASCCDPGAVDVSADSILTRLEVIDPGYGQMARDTVPDGSALAALERRCEEAPPPVRPASYRMLSVLLL